MDQEYWNNRAVELSESLFSIGDEAYAKLAQEYDRAMYRIEKEIEAFYGRFATENKISFSDAKQILTSSERKAFQMDLQEYIKKGETLNYSKEWSVALENASSVSRVNRLQSLQVQMVQQVEELHSKYNTGVTEMATKVLNDGYYKNIFEIQKAEGIGSSFARLDTEKVKTIINTPWAPDGSNFSKGIWKKRTELVKYLNTELTQAFIRGERADRLIKELKRKFGVSSKDAARLIQTENAFFSAMAKIESYKALGYTKYVIIAVMDGKTSQVCRDWDGETKDIEDFMPGKTAPPFHPRCRSTIAPHVSSIKKDIKEQPNDESKDILQKESESSKMNSAVDCKTFSDFKEYMTQEYSVKVNDVLETLDLESVTESVSGIEKVVNDFPQLKGTFKELGVTGSKNAVMDCSYSGKIGFSEHYYKNRKNALYSIKNEYGFHPTNSTVWSTGTHEAGHLIEAYLLSVDNRYVVKSIAWTDCTIAKEIVSEACKLAKKTVEGKGLTNSVLIKAISGYAQQDRSETLAEAIADYYCNGKDAQILSHKIVEVLRGRLK